MNKKNFQLILTDPKLLNSKFPQFNNKIIEFSEDFDFTIDLLPEHVINVLDQWKNNRISNEEISKWALFLLVADCYEVPDHPQDEFYYDSLLTILSKLSCPQIDGKLTQNIANEYITQLQSLCE